MALETLKGVKEIGGFKAIVMDELKEQFPEKFNESGAMDYKWFESDIRPNHFVYIRNDVNSISFTIQNGPIKENGVNGCQVDTIIEAAKLIIEGLNKQFPCRENALVVTKLIIEGLNKQFPCRENALVVTKLDEALHWLEHRKKDRDKRAVEGLSKA
jgi:hypothetical protein